MGAATDDQPDKKKRGPPEPPPLVIDTDDPLETLRKVLGADPDAAKEKAKEPRRGKRGE